MWTPEQEARDIIERAGYKDAQSLSSGDVVELANILNRVHGMRNIIHGEEFDNLMCVYRRIPMTRPDDVFHAFEAVKAFILRSLGTPEAT